MSIYGKELILDLRDASVQMFERAIVKRFCRDICEMMKMQRVGFHYIESEEDEEKDPKTYGFSAVQFIITSGITMHGLSLTGDLFINVFTCGEMNAIVIEDYALKFFGATLRKKTEIEREW